MNTLCGCPCGPNNGCYDQHGRYYTVCAAANLNSYNGYLAVYTAVYYRSDRWETQSQIYSLSRISDSLHGNLQKKFLRLSPLMSLYYILISVTNVNVAEVTENCQNIYDFCANLTRYINNSTSQLSTEQINLLTESNAKLLNSTQKLCVNMKATVEVCSKSNIYDQNIAVDMENDLAIMQNLLQIISIELNNVSSNTYPLIAYTQPSYAILASGFLNNTNDISLTIGYVMSTRIFYRDYWMSLYGFWRNTITLLYGISRDWFSSSQNLTNYFNNNIRPYTNSSLTNGTLIIDGSNIQVFDCNYNYQNNIVIQINQVMVKIILEILAVSILIQFFFLLKNSFHSFKKFSISYIGNKTNLPNSRHL